MAKHTLGAGFQVTCVDVDDTRLADAAANGLATSKSLAELGTMAGRNVYALIELEEGP